jgi:hypothetical protein
LEKKNKKLSEEEATSDKFGEKEQRAVRSRGHCGQVWRKSAKSCQKKKQLQTSLEEKNKKLSEEEATSDKFRGKV